MIYNLQESLFLHFDPIGNHNAKFGTCYSLNVSVSLDSHVETQISSDRLFGDGAFGR
jgi:hypothetical protein